MNSLSLYVIVSTLNPNVGVASITSPVTSLYIKVVLPAMSKWIDIQYNYCAFAQLTIQRETIKEFVSLSPYYKVYVMYIIIYTTRLYL